MQAVRIHSTGTAAALVLDDVAPPVAGASDIVVRVAASGINPIEWKIRSGAMLSALQRPLPAILGWECAGTVTAVGALVTNFAVGDAVYAYPEFAREGTHAQFVA